MAGLEGWRSRRMRDYHQHLPMNCGAVAAVFALYGLNEVVPENVVRDILVEQSVSGKQIERIINNGGKPQISSSFFGPGSTIKTTFEEKLPLSFFETCTPVFFPEVIIGAIQSNNARCLIISGKTSSGSGHWQTCYLAGNSKELSWYNTQDTWQPVIAKAFTGVPAGLLIVSGPPIS